MSLTRVLLGTGRRERHSSMEDRLRQMEAQLEDAGDTFYCAHFKDRDGMAPSMKPFSVARPREGGSARPLQDPSDS